MKLTLSPNAVQIESAEPLARSGPQPPPAPIVAQTPPVAFLANVGEPLARLCRMAELLCRQVAPLDLAGVPLYVVPQSAIQANFGNAETTYGYTLNWLDLILQKQLGTAWRGRGPCIVANDIAMTEDLGGDIEATFLATVLHELGHVFERDIRFEAAPDASAARMQFEGLRLAQAMQGNRWEQRFREGREVMAPASGRLFYRTGWNDQTNREEKFQKDFWLWRGMTVADILDMDHLSFSAEVPEDEYPGLTVGAEVEVVFPRFNHRRIAAKLSEISPHFAVPRDVDRAELGTQPVARRRVVRISVTFTTPPDLRARLVPGTKGMLVLK